MSSVDWDSDAADTIEAPGARGSVDGHHAADSCPDGVGLTETTVALMSYTIGINIQQAADFQQDVVVFERCFGLDVRFLHHHNHDHDCSSTCVKNVKKKTKEELAKMLNASHAPPCRFDFFRMMWLQLRNEIQRNRRRGKEVVEAPFIINAAARGQFGSVALERPLPFGSASSDCGLAALRCNSDYRHMAKGFPLGS